MEQHLKIECDANLSHLFLEDEIKFKAKDPQVRICKEKGNISFTITSETQKNIDRTKKSLQNIPLIYKKVISIQ